MRLRSNVAVSGYFTLIAALILGVSADAQCGSATNSTDQRCANNPNMLSGRQILLQDDDPSVNETGPGQATATNIVGVDLWTANIDLHFASKSDINGTSL
jgi:hypothetical protein